MNLDILRDTVKLTQVIRTHRETCAKKLCSPEFVERDGEPFIIGCMELSELPGFVSNQCCCGLDFCPGTP